MQLAKILQRVSSRKQEVEAIVKDLVTERLEGGMGYEDDSQAKKEDKVQSEILNNIREAVVI